MTSKTYINDIETLLKSLAIAKRNHEFNLYVKLLDAIKDETKEFIIQLEEECKLK